jgi:hypothetical protein
VEPRGGDDHSPSPRGRARLSLTSTPGHQGEPWCPTYPAIWDIQLGSAGAKMTAMRRSCALLVIAALLSACGASMTAPSSPGLAKASTYPPVPPGGTDCGINNEMSGWPTTTVPGPTVYSCLQDALSSGRPARFVVIRPSNVDSGLTTRDGYSIPAGIVITYRVFGPNRLQITTDGHAARGQVSTQNCTSLSQPASGSSPTPSGCQ